MRRVLPLLLAAGTCGCASDVVRREAERAAFVARVEGLVRRSDKDGLLALQYQKGMTRGLRNLVRSRLAWVDTSFRSIQTESVPLPYELPTPFEIAGRRARFNAPPAGMIQVTYSGESSDGETVHGVGTLLYSVVKGRHYITGYQYE